MAALTTRAAGLILLLAALGAGGWYGYQRWLAPKEAVAYRTAEVRRGTVISTISATGTVQPLLKVLVGSQVSGTVTQWYADFNDRVTAGFILAELDQDRFKAQLDQREAAVAVARARVEEAQARLSTATLDRERIEQARARAAASEYEMAAARAAEDAARAALHAAEAELSASEADARMAAIELAKTIIRSPIDGVVISAGRGRGSDRGGLAGRADAVYDRQRPDEDAGQRERERDGHRARARGHAGRVPG